MITYVIPMSLYRLSQMNFLNGFTSILRIIAMPHIEAKIAVRESERMTNTPKAIAIAFHVICSAPTVLTA